MIVPLFLVVGTWNERRHTPSTVTSFIACCDRNTQVMLSIVHRKKYDVNLIFRPPQRQRFESLPSFVVVVVSFIAAYLSSSYNIYIYIYINI